MNTLIVRYLTSQFDQMVVVNRNGKR